MSKKLLLINFILSILFVKCSTLLPVKQKVKIETPKNIKCQISHYNPRVYKVNPFKLIEYGDTNNTYTQKPSEYLNLKNDTLIGLKKGIYEVNFSKPGYLSLDTLIYGRRMNPYAILTVPIGLGISALGVKMVIKNETKNDGEGWGSINGGSIAVTALSMSCMDIHTAFNTPYGKLYNKKYSFNPHLEKINSIKINNVELETSGYLLTESRFNLFIQDTKDETFLHKNLLLLSYKISDSLTNKNKKLINFGIYEPNTITELTIENRFGENIYKRNFYYNKGLFMDKEKIKITSLNHALNQLVIDSNFITTIASYSTETKFEASFKIKSPKAANPKKGLGKIPEAVFTISSFEGQGSGVLISEDGYALTTYDVVKSNYTSEGNYDYLDITLKNGKKVDGDIIRVNKDLNIALIKLTTGNYKGLKTLTNLTNIINTQVYSIGTPLHNSLSQTITKGTITNKIIEDNNTYLTFDAAINKGNSGGPLVNKKGKIIGLTLGKVNQIPYSLEISTLLKGLNIEFY